MQAKTHGDSKRGNPGSIYVVGEEDVARRIQLTSVSLNKREKLWKHRSLVALDVRLKAYRALVE